MKPQIRLTPREKYFLVRLLENERRYLELDQEEQAKFINKIIKKIC